MESVITTHTFKLPADAHAPSLVIAHEGGFPIDWFIIGGGPFRKQPIVRLDEKENPLTVSRMISQLQELQQGW